MLLQALCIISYPLVNSNLSYSPEMLNSGQNRRLFETCDLEVLRMTPKTIGHLFYATSSFVYHFVPIGEFKFELQSGNAQFGSNSTIFRSRATLTFDGWSGTTIGHLFYDTSSFVQHFVPIGEFKLELQSGNAQSGSNLTILRAVWPCYLTDDLQKQ